ncbi:hypothetical protein EYF80_021631 [Liparis tanakae]|uniref:Uncharacterized protein n=1 Tax=Liparis tanakae TaxID=230148 RepID=A0A4Z2HQX8_9TELE|nr:hypothetical protein EYF80_021631 [Liparis tanakae]
MPHELRPRRREGGRERRAKADSRDDTRCSFTSERDTTERLQPPTAQGWLRSRDQWAGIPLFTLLKIDFTHCDDVASRDKTPLLLSSPPPLLHTITLLPPSLLPRPHHQASHAVIGMQRSPRLHAASPHNPVGRTFAEKNRTFPMSWEKGNFKE